MQINHDDALRLAPAGSALGRSLRGAGAEREQRPECEAHDGGAADAQQIAPRDAEVSVAKIAAGLSWDSEHDVRVVSG